MLGTTTNPLLQQTEQGVLQKVKPELKAPLERTVTAGLQVMYSKPEVLIQQLSKSNDFAHSVGEGSAKLVGVLFHQSKNTMPISIAVPAAVIFMCEGLDFLEKAGKVKVSPELLAEATQDTTASVLQLFGVTQDKMREAVAKKGGQSPQPKGIVGTAQGA
jgi:hypothetical protein